ncbi:phage baseplate assembly protein V [Pseudomonas kielensis]|uniref:phage baseplate assembly protein V n=1 Tax=Pseudomonas kielensis TaxID=2762577 RepID=UPI00223F4D45|nr:phage baseplate assembly protein V [Pseudomonas kielensis]UZM16230.1 phage baseplate assembly protein V [Pseudomonas kielensis]
MTTSRVEQSIPPELDIRFGTAKQSLQALVVASLETRQAANQIPNAKLVLKQLVGDGGRNQALAAGAKRSQPGTPVTITLKPGGVLFSGIVAEQTYRQTTAGGVLTLRLCHPLQGALSSHGSKVFTQQNDEAVLRQLLLPYDVKLSKASGLMSLRHSQLVQYECSDWQFIKARLYANGVWLWPDSDAGVSVAPPKLTMAKHTIIAPENTALTGPAPHSTLVEAADWVFSNRELTDTVGVSAWNASVQKVETRQASIPLLGSGAFDPKALNGLGPRSQTFNTSQDLQEGECQAWADSRLLTMQAGSVRGRFTVIGSPAYQLGDTLELKGFGEAFDGKGVISGIEHQLTPGHWRTLVTIGQDMLAEADVPLVPAAPGLQIGVVATYQKDPKRLDRIRVKVPALGGELWARFAAPYASKDSGVCFYPESDDEVVLGFFGADPCFPVILGAMHSPERPSPIDPINQRQQKGLILKHNGKRQQLLFDDQETSVLLESNKDSLTLHSGIKVDTSQAMTVTGDNITLKADNQLEVKGLKKVNIKGQKVDVGM